MQQVTCTCGFSVTSENEDELVKIVQNHAHGEHGMDMSVTDVKSMAKQV
jgi:predicted small metal-binding protein